MAVRDWLPGLIPAYIVVRNVAWRWADRDRARKAALEEARAAFQADLEAADLGWRSDEAAFRRALLDALRTSRLWSEVPAKVGAALGASPSQIEAYDWDYELLSAEEVFAFSDESFFPASTGGLVVLTLLDHSFLMDDNNLDELNPRLHHRIWGWWTPQDNRPEFERCVVEAWANNWFLTNLPPAIGYLPDDEWFDLPDEGALAFRCLDEIVRSGKVGSWEAFKEELEGARERLVANEGRLADSGSIPLPNHDTTWFLAVSKRQNLLDACRTDQRSRESLISYFMLSR